MMVCLGKILMIAQRQLQQQKGVASVEAALFISFILFPIFIGIVQAANVLVSYVAIINAARAGVTYFVSSTSSNINVNALAIVKASASTLNANNLSITTTVNGNACTSCDSLLKTKENFGTLVTFTVNYSYIPIQGIPQLSFFPSTLSYTTAAPSPSQ